MSNEIVLRPEELYFMGTLMNAAYIDYDYIASLQEIGRNFQQARNRCLLDLSRAKLVRQRLSGEITIRPQLEQMLRNVFFGKLETTLDVIVCGSKSRRRTYRFHYLEGTITMVTAENGSLTLTTITDEELKQLTRSAVGWHTEVSRRIARMDENSVTRMIITKRAEVDIGSTDCLLFEQDGALYTADSIGQTVSITDEQAEKMLVTMLKGE